MAKLNGLTVYRKNVESAGKELAKQAQRLSGGNLLSAKMALWQALSIIEEKMKEMKLEGGEKDGRRVEVERKVRVGKGNKKHN